MVEKGFALTAIAGEDGKLVSAFTKKSTARDLCIVDISEADPGASHSYRLSASTLQHVAHNGESWVFAYLPEKKYKSQTILKCHTLEAMLAQIKFHWKKGYRISSVAFGRGHWVSVATQYTNPGEQSFFTACDAEILQEKTKQAWDEGKRITGITYGDGKWLVILNQSATMYSQKWLTRKSFSDLRAKVREEWSQGFQITSLARGAGVWLVVFSKRTAK
ncbi:MAG: hypothetical protein K2X93_27350 [Candidatus Obscuribacterales bacterium]|nr:hypothetical protein [Candidatus Obscuribacterales bacterium]